MHQHIKIIGYLLIMVSFVHLALPKYFNWRTELASLSLGNRQVMKIHTFFIALMVLLIGLFCITSTDDIIHTDLGKKISLGMAIFWTIRLGFQFFGYSPKLWRNKPFETIVHIIFSLFWIYMSWAFWSIYFTPLTSQ